MRILLSMGALGMMAVGFSLMLDPAPRVDAAAIQPIVASVAAALPELASAPPPGPVQSAGGLKIELVGPERFEMGDQIGARAWVALESAATGDCARPWPTTTVADASGLLGGV